MRSRALLIAGLLAILVTGCLPRTFVKKDPGPHDRGIRYYRPKPYLMVKPLVAFTEKDKPGTVQPGYVSLETVTLPDYSEEYSIHIRSGLGVNNTSITLEDGWNLTAVNANLDSQFDENVKAIAELVKVPLAGRGSEAGKLQGDGDGGMSMMVPAYNVPYGLYEAVISTDSHGRKRLYGFRYVGFFPYSTCPMESCGVTHETCDSTPLYGLVFDKQLQAMVFKELHELAAKPLQVGPPPETRHASVDAGTSQQATNPPATEPENLKLPAPTAKE